MNIEWIIILIKYIISVILIVLVPKDRRREALVAYVAMQCLTWVISTALVHYNILEFPIREFDKATKTSFSSEFLFYPLIFMWFYLTFPKDLGKLRGLFHYFVFISIIAWYLFLAGKLTNLVKFVEFRGIKPLIRPYIIFYIEFWVAKRFTEWFFKESPWQEVG